MLRIKNTEVWGLDRAIKSSGNAMAVGEIDTLIANEDKDYKRGERLGSTPVGSAHDHYLVGIHVQFDIIYPQYWTIEAERYHNFEIITSQSKMHRLTMMGKDEDFYKMFNKYVDKDIIKRIQAYITEYNHPDNQNPITEFDKQLRYELFMQILSNLPMGFEMGMTCDLTYLQIKGMVLQRKHNKLKEDWGEFCRWAIEELPRFSELTGIISVK